jgi:hypothetical protein
MASTENRKADVDGSFSAILSLRNSNKLNMTRERERNGDETKWTNPTWLRIAMEIGTCFRRPK